MLTKDQRQLAEMLREAMPDEFIDSFECGFECAMEAIIRFLQRDEIMDTQKFRETINGYCSCP